MPYTEIVITSFGDDEIFPSIYSCKIYGKLGKYLLMNNEKKEEIAKSSEALIIPFAHSKRTTSFMEGVDIEFEWEIQNQIESLVDNIGKILDESYKEKLSRIKNEFFEYIKNYKKTNFMKPVTAAISFYNEPELADLAETIVKMAVLKKHVFNGSTGGSVDVAVMTKGNGFIWIKRKQCWNGEKHDE